MTLKKTSKKTPTSSATRATTPGLKPKSKAKPKTVKAKEEIPSILFEGDAPSAPRPSGPGKRYALGSAIPVAGTWEDEESQSLPESYGTQRLILTARDPHWLYAHWDLTQEQQRKYNELSESGHLVLRVFQNEVSGQAFTEIPLHRESRNWFVHVGAAGAKFVGVLGYYEKKNNRWTPISTSEATVTPPDSMSEDTSFWSETLPADLQFEKLVALVREAVKENVPLIEAIQQLRSTGHKGLPSRKEISAETWTPEQEHALGEIVSMDSVRRVWMGSLEITELIRRNLQREISSMGVAQFSQLSSWSGAVSSLASPFGGLPSKKEFWFNVNAELIIYGATEPDAHVTIGGRQIRLRPDGTFSFRFALPDGNYELPAVAQSADGTDTRSAELEFKRSTQYRGDVGHHPQDPKLKAPRAEHLS